MTIERLDRILKVRQLAVDEAEQRVRIAESQLGLFRTRLTAEEGKIRQCMEEFADPDGMTGSRLQRSERAIEAGRVRAARIRQDIEKIELKLEEHWESWRQARREHGKIEKLRERQLQRIVREERVLAQKAIDESSVQGHLRASRA